MSFSSGSCGNCYYLGTGDKGILIDAGVSLRRLKKTLMENGLDMDSFSAILVTHDHLDHIRHLGSFCKRIAKPVFTTEDIHSALARHTFTADHISSCRNILSEGGWNEVAGFKVRYFVVPHDATQTVGYAIDIDDRRFVIMTDIGRILGAVLAMVIGIGVGIIGMILVCLAYPIYNRTLKKEREKIAPEIIRLTDELMK